MVFAPSSSPCSSAAPVAVARVAPDKMNMLLGHVHRRSSILCATCAAPAALV